MTPVARSQYDSKKKSKAVFIWLSILINPLAPAYFKEYSTAAIQSIIFLLLVLFGASAVVLLLVWAISAAADMLMADTLINEYNLSLWLELTRLYPTKSKT